MVEHSRERDTRYPSPRLTCLKPRDERRAAGKGKADKQRTDGDRNSQRREMETDTRRTPNTPWEDGSRPCLTRAPKEARGSIPHHGGTVRQPKRNHFTDAFTASDHPDSDRFGCLAKIHRKAPSLYNSARTFRIYVA